jgi:hypothetical protein
MADRRRQIDRISGQLPSKVGGFVRWFTSASALLGGRREPAPHAVMRALAGREATSRRLGSSDHAVRCLEWPGGCLGARSLGATFTSLIDDHSGVSECARQGEMKIVQCRHDPVVRRLHSVSWCSGQFRRCANGHTPRSRLVAAAPEKRRAQLGTHPIGRTAAYATVAKGDRDWQSQLAPSRAGGLVGFHFQLTQPDHGRVEAEHNLSVVRSQRRCGCLPTRVSRPRSPWTTRRPVVRLGGQYEAANRQRRSDDGQR